jgi:hypothetical protein
VDSNAVSRTQVVADPFLESRCEPARVHVEIDNRVEQELQFTITVGDEKAACDCSAFMVPPLMLAALVSLLAIAAGWSTLLPSGSEAALVPAECGCSVISGGGSDSRTAVPWPELGSLEF